MVRYLRKERPVNGLNVALFSLILTSFFIILPGTPHNSPDPSAQELSFQVAAAGKRTDLPVHWVTAGGGVLAFGAGQHVDFALGTEPISSISRLSFDGVIAGGLIIGKYALLSQEGLGLRIVDLEVLSNPLDLGFYPLSGSNFRLANWGNLLFVGGTNNGVRVFELSDGPQGLMSQPQITLIDRGIIPVEESITAIAAEQGKLYVATTGKEIRIYDVSDPSFVLEAEGLSLTWPVRSLAISGNSLFVATGTEGLHILDLSFPGKIETVATYPVPSESLCAAGRLIYLAAGSNGLHLLKVGLIGATTFNIQSWARGRFLRLVL